MEATNYIQKSTGSFLDTLHVVNEDAAREQGSFTGIRPLLSKGRGSGTSTPVVQDEDAGNSKRNGIRFPRHAVKTLRDWMSSHADNPYPNREEKAELERKTELKPNQIADWMANARRRRKATEKTKPKPFMSPSLRPQTQAIEIPRATPGPTDKPWDELDPFERWKHSPPEHEPASMKDIANAVAQSELPDDDDVSDSPLSFSHHGKGSSNGSGLSKRKAPSTGSLETVPTSSLSASSAVFSHGSSNSTHGSFGSFSSSLVGKKDRRRRRRPVTATPVRNTSDTQKRIFQCTFCTDTFKSKYDWTRHEKSLHLSQEKWICAPQGAVIIDQDTGGQLCVYCDAKNPSKDHIEAHNHQQCVDKGLDSRTFYRKDHLRQHLRLVHGCEMIPSMDRWKSAEVNINSRCGFCGRRFTTWQERTDHLTAHFKAGSRMSEWKGCRGFHPAVAAQVTNAMPPYLIGMESVSPYPFSATNPGTWRQHQAPDEPEGSVSRTSPLRASSKHRKSTTGYDQAPRTTCYEILAIGLGNYAKDLNKKGVVITDEMLQTQARKILFGSDDSWNQTAADNPEWLDLFKKALGLDFIPSTIGGRGSEFPSDLEMYGDLGIRVPFALQLQALNKSQLEGQTNAEGSRFNSDPKLLTQSQKNLLEEYPHFIREGVLCGVDNDCSHMDFATSLIGDTSTMDNSSPEQIIQWNDDAMSDIDAPFNDSLQWDIDQHIAPMQQMDDFPLGLLSLWDSDEFMSDLQNNTNRQESFDVNPYADLPLLSNGNQCAASSTQIQPSTLATTTSSGQNQDVAPSQQPNKNDYLPHYQYELPQNRAQMFETVTGAWLESGLMPESSQTNQPNISQP